MRVRVQCPLDGCEGTLRVDLDPGAPARGWDAGASPGIQDIQGTCGHVALIEADEALSDLLFDLALDAAAERDAALWDDEVNRRIDHERGK